MKLKIIFVGLFFAGCSFVSNRESPAIYDLGMTSGPVIKISQYRFAGIDAAPGLDSRDIRYRLTYKNPSRIYAYSESRWAAIPAALFAQYLQNRVVFSNSNATSCKVRLKLESFDQVFDTPQSSKGVLKLQVFIEKSTGRPILQQEVTVESPAETTDAQGGVTSLITSADLAIQQLSDLLSNRVCNKE